MTARTQTFIVELKENGSCIVTTDGNQGTGIWSVKDGVISITDGADVITGTISDGVIRIKNMLNKGVNITLVRQQS